MISTGIHEAKTRRCTAVATNLQWLTSLTRPPAAVALPAAIPFTPLDALENFLREGEARDPCGRM